MLHASLALLILAKAFKYTWNFITNTKPYETLQEIKKSTAVEK